MSNELKPCPKGHIPELFTSEVMGLEYGYSCICDSGVGLFKTEIEARTRWNARYSHDAPKAWLYTHFEGEVYCCTDPEMHMHEDWTETPLYAQAVVDHETTPNHVDDREKANMSGKPSHPEPAPGLVERHERSFREGFRDGWRYSQTLRLASPAAEDEAWKFYRSPDGENAARIQSDAVELARVNAALRDVTVSLLAAISLLERGGKAAKKAAPSDRMFAQMILDYKASIARARAALGTITRKGA